MVKYVTSILSGGLGNQLFQIAAAYALALDMGIDFRISYLNFFGAGQGYGPDRYKESVYSNLNFENDRIYDNAAVIWEQIWTYAPIQRRAHELLHQFGYLCLQGYMQSELYFAHRRKEIKGLLTPRGGYSRWLMTRYPALAEQYKELFEDHGYCFIGVRRGDYLKPSNRHIHNPCGMAYYTKAMSLAPATRYYVASDDIEWCKRTFVGPQFRFFEFGHEEDHIQLAFMTLFRRFIIANSTFYWWGSYLSQYEDSRVIAPDKWIFGSDVELWRYYSVYRDDMVVLERPIEF